MTGVLGLRPFQWIVIVAALLTLLVMVESWVGHYRSGFPLRAQYAPLAGGAALIISCVLAAAAPEANWAQRGLRTTGWIAVVLGVVGVGYHHYYGIVEKAGGYRWLLHYLMYGAPQLAPLALSTAGALAAVAASGLAGDSTLAGVDLSRLLLGIVALALTGAIAQTGILHYRGAFNTPVMYLPLVLPPLSALGAAWLALNPSAGIAAVVRGLLWATFLLGFIGLGMHLRGIDRQMGGLHVFIFNVLQGPPALAPAAYAALAAIGILALGAG